MANGVLPRPQLPLSDGTVSLVPLAASDVSDFLLLAADLAVDAFTPVPIDADAAYFADMLERCNRAWREGSGAFFSIRDSIGESFLGYAGAIRLQLGAHQGELGYMVARHARGQGVATRAVNLLSEWCFDELGVIRLELRIDPRNDASTKVAEATGYQLEGLLRSLHLKGDQRVDVGIWSRLSSDAMNQR